MRPYGGVVWSRHPSQATGGGEKKTSLGEKGKAPVPLPARKMNHRGEVIRGAGTIGWSTGKSDGVFVMQVRAPWNMTLRERTEISLNKPLRQKKVPGEANDLRRHHGSSGTILITGAQ